MWEVDHKEGLVPKNWCFQTVVLQKTLESHLESKEIKPVNHKRNQPWIFIERTDAEAEAPILWPPDAKSRLIWKDLDAEKDWGQEEKQMTEDEMDGWHNWLDGCESGWTLGVGDGQGGLACCDSWGRKEPDTTERVNWTELFRFYSLIELLSDSDFLQQYISQSVETRVKTNTSTHIFIAALFTIAQRCKEPKRPSLDGWVNCGIYMQIRWSINYKK